MTKLTSEPEAAPDASEVQQGALPLPVPEPRPACAAEFIAAACAGLSVAFACNDHWLVAAAFLALAAFVFLRSRPRDAQGRILLSGGRLLFGADGDSSAD